MKIFNGIIVRLHAISLRQMVLQNEQQGESKEVYCHLRKIQALLSDEKTPYERRFGEPFCGTTFGAKVEHHLISTKDQARLHQFGKKVFSYIFMGYALYALGSCKGDILVVDVEEIQECRFRSLCQRRK